MESDVVAKGWGRRYGMKFVLFSNRIVGEPVEEMPAGFYDEDDEALRAISNLQ